MKITTDTGEWEVKRRFREFRELDAKVNNFPLSPPPPKRTFHGRLKFSFSTFLVSKG